MVQVLSMKQVTSVHQNPFTNYTYKLHCAYKLLFQLFIHNLSNCFFRKVICVLDVIQEMEG